MNTQQQRRSLIAFFLGTQAAIIDQDDPDLVPIAGRRAYRDLSRTLHGIGSHPEADSLRQDTYETLKSFVTDKLRSGKHCIPMDWEAEVWINRSRY